MSLVLDEMRLTREAIRYGFAVGKVRVLETRTVDKASLERLLDASSFTEQKRLLSETPYGRFLEGVETAEQVELALDEALDSWLRFIKAADLPEDIASYFRVQYDYNNLRGAAKARLLGASLDGLLTHHGSVPAEDFSADLGTLPGSLGTLARSLVLEPSENRSVAQTSLAIDDAIDEALFAEMLRLAVASKSRFLIEFTRLRIDLANARALVRGASAGLPAVRVEASLLRGGTMSAESLAPLAGSTVTQIAEALSGRRELRALRDADLSDPDMLDVALDSLALRALERGRRGPIGPEPVIAYVLARQSEVVVLRVLLLGRLSGIDSEILRARVNTVRG